MRIRTIKPEFWTDEKVAGWDAETRLAYIWTWSAADDYGRLRLTPAMLRSGAFTYHDMKMERAREILATLTRSGRVVLYVVEGEVYGQVVSWEKHQKVDKPGKFQNPSPEQGVPYDSRECRESVARVSLCTVSGTVPEVEGNGVEVSYPSGTLAPSPRKAKAPKHDKPALNMETWEWENITDSYRKAWSEDFPGINLDDELRKARAWVRADPAKRRKKDWVRFLGTTWFKNAQERASSTQRIPIVDSRTTQLQSERAWQSVARMAAAMPTGDSLEAAMSMLPERTLDALKQWGKYPSLTIQNIGQMSYQQQETCHVAFCKAWLASEVVDKEEVES